MSAVFVLFEGILLALFIINPGWKLIRVTVFIPSLVFMYYAFECARGFSIVLSNFTI